MVKKEVYVIQSTHLQKIWIEQTIIAEIASGTIVFPTEQQWADFGLENWIWEASAILVIEPKKARNYDLSRQKIITMGGKKTDTIRFGRGQNTEIICEQQDDMWILSLVGTIRGYLNLKRIKQEVILQWGDIFFVEGVLFIFTDGVISVTDYIGEMMTDLNEMGSPKSPFGKDYPNYHRSPRIIYPLPDQEITLLKPPPIPSKPSEGIWKILIPPLTMMGMTIIANLIQPRGIYAIIGLVTTLITSITAAITYVNNLKKYKKDTVARERTYTKYLKNKNKEIAQKISQQIAALEYHLPSIQTLTAMVEAVDYRIYEITMHHHDFLHFRIGLTDVEPSFAIKYEVDEMNDKKDELTLMADELAKFYQTLPKLPYAIDLKQGAVGFIGSRKHVLEQLELMIAKLSVFHSYHDLELITIFPQEQKEQWAWARWLRQTKMQEVNIRGFVYHDRSRDQVLSSLHQILKARKQEKADKSADKMQFSPHYLVTITDETLIVDHSIMALMQDGIEQLGVTLVFVEDHIEKLAEYVKTVIEIRDAKEATIILENGQLKNKKILLDHFPKKFNKERISRSLAPLNHLLTLTNTIPKSVGFLELYDVEQIEDLKIEQRWSENAPHKSLGVPLGLRGVGDVVFLNLHEKAHGPHGLIAGTTGSGKSEIIQSYILSLAVNFHPFDVAFLLIDYKGGGMANLFKDLPHHLGSITNLDGAQSMRALISIKAELQRRQRLFSENDVNHINQYQKLFKEGVVTTPMPHLFLISDEFAELKAEQPEFMKELVSTARIGRSLGIHLILATQKPSGVVDDQIWSNSKFKVALKVQDVSDSNEMLKTPDAASITLPGRAYLQVGNNEIYELFQSAWSGASYYKTNEKKKYIDDTIYKINELGQYEILSDDLSGLEKVDFVGKVETELEAIIGFLADYTKKHKIEKLPQPWLPPLERRFVVSSPGFEVLWGEQKPAMAVEIGVVDQPHIQAQNPFLLDLSKDLHAVVLSSPGFGKSTTLQTITMQLARIMRPDQLHVYLLDFGTNGLLALKHLPHVADTMRVDNEAKIGKFARRISAEIKARKEKLSKFSVASLRQYEQASGLELPSIIIVIDNYDVIRDTNFSEGLEALNLQISREGGSVGIHLLLGATSFNAIRMTMSPNIKLRLMQFMHDSAEVSSVIGRSDLKIDEVAGRGLVNLDQPTAFQIGLPGAGIDELAVILGLRDEANAMVERFTGVRPLKIPLMPKVLSYNRFFAIESVNQASKTQNLLPIGLDFENIEAVNWDLNAGNFTIAFSKQKEAEVYASYFIEEIKKKEHKIVILDSPKSELDIFENQVNAYANNAEDYTSVIAEMAERFEQRKEEYSEYRKTTATPQSIKFYFKQTYKIVIVLNNFSVIEEKIRQVEVETIANLIEEGSNYNIIFLIVNEEEGISRGYSDLAKILKKEEQGAVNIKLGDQVLFNITNKTYHEKRLNLNEIYHITGGTGYKIKIFER
ncbi:MAG: type VII secretion protein EssC [Culicoidibacterales bacterium]